MYKEAKAAAERKTAEAESKAKEGWFSWLGWGKSKVEEGKQEGAAKADEMKGEMKGKIDQGKKEGAAAADDVKRKIDRA